jgi:hypothetical protein
MTTPVTSTTPTLLKVGDRVKFMAERLCYRVRACNERFAVCTKPFNPRHTVLYTLIDLEREVRGTENMIFGLSFEMDQDCKQALARLASGETEVSWHNCIPLDIQRVLGA